MGRQVTGLSTIYAIRNKENGKVYIGRSTKLEHRIKQHWQEKRRMIQISKEPKFMGSLTDFEKDFECFGQNAFEVYRIEECVPPEMCRQREAFWISEYNATDPRFGYNKSREVAVKVDSFIRGLPPNISKAQED